MYVEKSGYATENPNRYKGALCCERPCWLVTGYENEFEKQLRRHTVRCVVRRA
jgi:hypothetical protein